MNSANFYTRGAPLLALALLPLLLAGCGGGGQASQEPDPLVRGWNEYRLGEYKLAITAFEEARAATSVGDDTHLNALFGLATTWNLRQPQTDQDKDLARDLYEELIRTAPGHDLAAWSQLALARMIHLVPVGEEPDYEAVRVAYQEVLDAYPDHLAGHEAFMYQQASLVRTLDQAVAGETLGRLQAFMKTYPDTNFKSLAYELMSRCHKLLEQYDERLAAEINAFQTMEKDPTSPFQDNAFSYWKIATIAEFEAGNFAVARAYYRKLVEEYPSDQKTFASQQALERMDGVEARLRAERTGGNPPGETPL